MKLSAYSKSTVRYFSNARVNRKSICQMENLENLEYLPEPIGIHPLIQGSALIDSILKGSPERSLCVIHPLQKLYRKVQILTTYCN